MTPFGTALTVLALTIAGLTVAAILWSVAQPDRRIWPPHRFSAAVSWIGWGGTFAFFATVFALGVVGWGEAPVPSWLSERYGKAYLDYKAKVRRSL